MIITIKRALLVFLSFTAVSAASNTAQQVRVLQHLAQPSMGWIKLNGVVPIVQGRASFNNPVTVPHPGLLQRDAFGQVLLIPDIEKGKTSYRLVDSSGVLLGGFTLTHHNDLPAPAIQIDAQKRRIYFMEVDGRLCARDFQGKKIWEIPPPQDYAFTYENTFFICWNAPQQTLSTVYSAPSPQSGAGFHTLIREYDAGGRLSGQRILPGIQTLKLVCNRTGQKKLLLAKQTPSPASMASVLLLDSLNRIVWQKERGFRQALFLPDNQIVLTGKQNLRLIDGLSGEILREFQPFMDGRMIADVLSAGDSQLGVVFGNPFYRAGKLRYARPAIWFMDLKTEARRQVSLQDKIYLPRALFLTENGQLQIGCENGLYQIVF